MCQICASLVLARHSKFKYMNLIFLKSARREQDSNLGLVRDMVQHVVALPTEPQTLAGELRFKCVRIVT